MVTRIIISVILISCCTALWPKATKKISDQELARHNTAKDCWMEINGNIYDVSEYSAEHKSVHEYDYTKWCGKAASGAWADKDGRGKDHNRKAHLILKRYWIGEK